MGQERNINSEVLIPQTENVVDLEKVRRRRERRKSSAPIITKVVSAFAGLVFTGGVASIAKSAYEINQDTNRHNQKVERAIEQADEKFPIANPITVEQARTYYDNPVPYDPEKIRQAHQIKQNSWYNHQLRTKLGATTKPNPDEKKIVALGAGVASVLSGAIILSAANVAKEKHRKRRPLPNFK